MSQVYFIPSYVMSEVYINCNIVLYVIFYVICHSVISVNYHFVFPVICQEEVGITFPPCRKEVRSDEYLHRSKVTNWHGIECIQEKGH